MTGSTWQSVSLLNLSWPGFYGLTHVLYIWLDVGAVQCTGSVFYHGFILAAVCSLSGKVLKALPCTNQLFYYTHIIHLRWHELQCYFWVNSGNLSIVSIGIGVFGPLVANTEESIETNFTFNKKKQQVTHWSHESTPKHLSRITEIPLSCKIVMYLI